ncbi:MAG: hypothetical protein HDT13_05495 [Butyrivibrio sp.]|nr:hypothetical protein [Butyrivibrio sp.]
MRKRRIFGIMALFISLALLLSGCAMRKSSYIVYGIKGDNFTVDDEAWQNAKYKSIIEKYVGKSGESYTANDYMIKNEMTAKHSAEEWLDADGKLKLPFDPDDIKETDRNSYGETAHEIIFLVDGTEHYYVPDEIAIKASTEELTDVFISYGYNGGFLPMVFGRNNLYRDYEHAFALFLSNCNAIEESLRREDFAKLYFERYMTESENMPKRYDGGNYPLYFVSANKTGTLNVIEVLLAQPEAYAQLTLNQREMLVRRVLEREMQGERGELLAMDADSEYWTYFFACIAGEMYLPADMAAIPDTTGGLAGITGAIQREDNPWLDTVNEMDFTEDEQKILEKYFIRR